MNKKISSILKNSLDKVRSKEDILSIEKILKDFINSLKLNIKKNKLKAEIFIGGSFAKKTLIKKDKYDIDIFLRFDKEYLKSGKSISELCKELLKKTNEKFLTIHGSRDYFRIEKAPNLFFEIVPVIKVNKPEQADNITDLSYSHVKYINNKIKNEKIRDEIKLAKAFCYAKEVYGAESYINGFSGYSLELLIIHYKTFLKFITSISKMNLREKEFIDIEKFYRNKNLAFMDINSAKLSSPIILVDPTFKKRNALAALSYETLEKFQKDCVKFLKNPSEKDFEITKIELIALEKEARKRKNQFIVLEAETDRQEGNVAGSKLFKFFNFISKEISDYFIIKQQGFIYGKEKKAKFYFEVQSKKEIILEGPFIDKENHVKAFKKKHSKTYVKNKRVFSKKKLNLKINDFLKKWLKENKEIVSNMCIISLSF